MKDLAVTGHAPVEPYAIPAGEALSAAELFRRHAPFVARFLLRLGVDGQDADDLVQEVFIVAHRKGGFVQATARPTTWLADIAVRVASTHRRSRNRRSLREAPADVASGGGNDPVYATTPADSAEAARALDRVQRALHELDLERRAVFVLYELEGQPCDQIALALGVPVGTVYSRLHAARREFIAAYQAKEARVRDNR